MQPKLNEEALRAKSDSEVLAHLIRTHRPLMLAAVRFHMRSVRDEYLQLAQDAFCEAVRAYDPRRGAFLPLCRRIIRMRLIDERRRSRVDRELPMADLSEEARFTVEQRASLQAHKLRSREEERREEIQDFARALQKLGISLSQVQASCPRHQETRQTCLLAVDLIRRDPQLLNRTLHGRLPIAALCAAFDTGDKIWERHRRYLIAAVLAVSGDYPHIAQFVLPRGKQA